MSRLGNRSIGTLLIHNSRSGREPKAGFIVLSKRRVVERIHAWGEYCRRMAMRHDRKTPVSAMQGWFAEAHILRSRLANLG